jgi:hypothetical protein
MNATDSYSLSSNKQPIFISAIIDEHRHIPIVE